MPNTLILQYTGTQTLPEHNEHTKNGQSHMKYQIIERVKIQRIHLQVIKTITSAIRTIQSGAT